MSWPNNNSPFQKASIVDEDDDDDDRNEDSNGSVGGNDDFSEIQSKLTCMLCASLSLCVCNTCAKKER